MSDIQTNLFINGQYVPSSSKETLSIYSPNDDSLVTDKVQVASEADVDRAVDAAKAAFPAWRDTSGPKRAEIMLKSVLIARTILNPNQSLTHLRTTFAGSPTSSKRTSTSSPASNQPPWANPSPWPANSSSAP